MSAVLRKLLGIDHVDHRLAQALQEFRQAFVWVGICSFFLNLLMLVPTLYMMQVFDRVLSSGNEFTLLALTLITVGLLGLMAFAEWLRSRILVRIGLALDARLSHQVFDAALANSLRGDAAGSAQAFQDLTQLRQFVTGSGVFVVFDLPWMVVFIAVLALMSPWLGLAALAFTALFLVLMLTGQRRIAVPIREAADAAVAEAEFLRIRLRNLETVQAMGMSRAFGHGWQRVHGRHMRLATQAAAHAGAHERRMKFLQAAQQSLALAIGAWLVVRGELSPGAMIASNALLGYALRPVTVLTSTWKQFVEAGKARQRLMSLLASPEGAPAESSPTSKPDGPYRLVLEGLKASTPDGHRVILHGLDATFVAGEIVAIVGPSGAGKSTLARCLAGVWPRTEGRVVFQGRDLAQWPRHVLGQRIGYVPQDIELLDGTLAENIARMGEVDADQVVEAARQAGIHDMALRFPQGYETRMGPGGMQLSGGQRQRVALARALHGAPDLLVLDEPSANLDDQGLLALAKALEAVRARGGTVFMVLHQRNLLTLADRVLELDAGRITQLAALNPSRKTAS